MSAIDSGFTFPSSVEAKDNIIDLVTCSTGNCTFGQYSTLALCTKCADITESIVCGDGTCEKPYRLSVQNDTVSLDPVTGFLNITSDTSYPSSETLSDIGPLIARYLGLGFTRTFAQGGHPNATECALYWCVNTYNASASGSNFNEEMTESWTNLTSSRTRYGQDTRIYLTPDHCYINGSKSTSDSGNCDFGVDPLSQRALQNYLVNGSEYANTSGFLSGSVSLTTGAAYNDHWLVDGLAANAIMSPYYYTDYTTEAVYELFDRCFASMANYMSKAIRKIADLGPGYSYGTTNKYLTYFHVRWGWLAYPILVVILAFVFLVITMIKSRHTEPWKSSVTALLFHGLTDEDKNANLHLDDPEEMRTATENWIVRLQDEGGVRSFRKKGNTAWTLHVPEEGSDGVRSGRSGMPAFAWREGSRDVSMSRSF